MQEFDPMQDALSLESIPGLPDKWCDEVVTYATNVAKRYAESVPLGKQDIDIVTMKVLEKLRVDNMLPPININGTPRQGVSLDLYAQMLNMQPSDFDQPNTNESL